MPRYGYKAIIVTADEYGTHLLSGETVYERDDAPTNTGLVDGYGRAIWRFPDERVIGFAGKLDK